MKTKTIVKKSATAARPAAFRPASKTLTLSLAEYELVNATLREFVRQRTPAEGEPRVRGRTSTDLLVSDAVAVALRVLGKLDARADENEVLVRFTASQMQRMKGAAAAVGGDVTVKELIVAGALQSLDFEDSPLDEAVECVQGAVDFYARGGATVPDGDYRDDHPLGTAKTNAEIAQLHRAWFQEREGARVSPRGPGLRLTRHDAEGLSNEATLAEAAQ